MNLPLADEFVSSKNLNLVGWSKNSDSIYLLNGKTDHFSQYPENIFVNTPSPSGTGIIAVKTLVDGSNNFYATVDNLIPGNGYVLSFYQSNGFRYDEIESTYTSKERSNDPNLPHNFIPASFWQVSFGGDMINSNLSIEKLETEWQFQKFFFIATSTSQILRFNAVKVKTTNRSRFPTNKFLLISDIFLGPEECNPKECSDFSSFNPAAGNYLLSAWVKEKHNSQVQSYVDSAISIAIDGVVTTATPYGAIIDGWQKIDMDFSIPDGASQFELKLINNYIDKVYFDDIRVHPYDGNMKSFVYDQETQRLMAELDENNYATFYEYDKEGGLVRVKKETERGIKTIQETRSGNVKNE